MNTAAKAGIWYVVCNVLQRGINFLVIPIYTRLLTPAEYGVYAVFQSWKEILIIFATLNLFAGIYTKALIDYEDDRDRYTASMQGLGTMTTVMMCVVYLIRPTFWDGIFQFGGITTVLLFAFFLVFPSFSFWSARQRVELRYKLMVVVTLLVSVLTPAISIVLLLATDWGANAVIWGYLVVQIAVGAVFYVQIFMRGKAFFIASYWRHALSFNIPLIPHYLSLIVLGQVDRIMIQDICGQTETGIYTLAYQISMAANVVVAGINGSFVPWLYEQMKRSAYDATRKVSMQLSICVAFMVGALMMLGPEVVAVFATEEYYAAIWVIPAVATSTYFMFVYGLFSNVEFYFDATIFVTIATTVGAVTKIALNLAFIPTYGFIAAGYTTLFCYFMLMLMHWLFSRIVCRRRIGGASAISNRLVAVSSVAMFAIMALCVVLYSYPVLRYVFVTLVAIFGIAMRKRFIGFLKEVRS